MLKIGALPIKLALISQSTVSATLGQQALDQGLKAGLVGLGLVVLFLLFYYRFLGLIAALGLLVYAIFYFALIKALPITVTLPGIAGLILTIGVAADSNIVIFERIKEEVRAGRSMLSAISEGYRKGIATIVDANVIILLTAFILFGLATAGVKGFAFTLGIGTIVSLFTAVLFTQAIFGLLGRSNILRRPSFLGASGEGRPWKFDFTGASKWFFSLSGCILAIGAIAFATKQLNLGIDFESGTRIEAALAKPATVDQVRQALEDGGIDGAGDAKIQTATNPDFGNNVIQIQAQISPDQTNRVQPLLDRSFGLENGNASFDSTSVGPTFGQEVAKKAVIAIIFSLLVISAYVAIRFEAKYAVPVVIALIHDILITGGVYALVGREVTSGTVAAFLTILGYSMYDTIIVFDRVRENVPRMPRAAFSQIVNRSMSEVLTRSLITGPLDRVPDRRAAGLRRHHAAGLRLRDDGRRRLRYVLVDLHRLPGAHRVEGARARLPIPPGADQGGDGVRPHVPGGQRGGPHRRGRAPRAGRGRRRQRGRRRGARAGGRARPGAGRGCRSLADRARGGGRPAATGRARCPGGAHRRGGRRWGRGRPEAGAERTKPPPRPKKQSRRRRKHGRTDDAEGRSLMAALVWFTTGVALWHFTVFLPDRFWGGIVGALLGAVAGALITGALGQIATGDSIGQTGIETVLFAIPGTLLGIAAIYFLGSRQEAARLALEA